ncbi:MAG: hypothetical protein EBS90_10980 [Betaproteobacteria bacterium]|nr:hypothetical protein [Betaproteobacteria bacterium]
MAVAVRHLIELLACGTIGAYCVWRCYAILPLAIAEAHALVVAYLGRVRELERLVEPEAE